jgi:hypothetical protein
MRQPTGRCDRPRIFWKMKDQVPDQVLILKLRDDAGKTVHAAAFALLAFILLSFAPGCAKRSISLRGAVLERNSDPRKQSPISGVEVTATTGSTSSVVQTDSLGYFHVNLRSWIRSGQPVYLEFRRAGYEPLSLNATISDNLYIIDMVPIPAKVQTPTKQPTASIANVKVRFSMKSTGAVNVGSAVKDFEVVNVGNIPCNGKPPCSPDGKWKASIGSTTLDAGEGNEFRNVRLSCVAGPCPFTRIASDQYTKGGRKITVSVLNWSDTTTFLVEAEVYRPMVTEVVQDSYPLIFGNRLNFSVPDSGEGVSIEAEVNGEQLVFPLGPSLCLKWANCTVTTDKENSASYRCELRDGFEFR